MAPSNNPFSTCQYPETAIKQLRFLTWPGLLIACILVASPLPAAETTDQVSARRQYGVSFTRAFDFATEPPEPIPLPAADNPITLAEIEHLALAHNPSLVRAQALVDAARGNWVQAGLPINPLVGYQGQQLGSGGQAEQHGVLVEQEFIRGCKRQLSRAVAEQEIVIAVQQLAAQEQRVLTDVRLAFVDVLLAQRRLELSHQLAGVARQGVETVESLRKAGESSRIDHLQADMEFQSARILVVSAHNRLAASRRSLAAVVGVPELPPGALNGDLEALPADLSWPDSLNRLLTNSPEIAAAAASIERSRWELQRAEAEPVPNWTIQGVVMRDNGIAGKTDGTLQMTLPLPLYNRNQGAIRRSQANVVAAEQALAQLELRLQNELAPVFERYASATNQVRQYRELILPAASESLELVRQGHKAGEFPFLNLLTAQRIYFQTNLQYLDAVRDLRSAAIEIDGLLLRNSQSSGM